MEVVAEVFAFTVDVDPFVEVALDMNLFGAEHLHMLRVVEEIHEGQWCGDGEVIDRNLVDDGDVEKSVGELRFRRNREVVTILAAVGDGDKPGFAFEGASIDSEMVVAVLIAGIFAEEEAGVGFETTFLDGFEETGDIGVEAHTRGVHREVFVVDDDGVDGLGVEFVEILNSECGTQGNLEGARQSVAAAAGDDAHVDTAVLEPLCHIIDATVATYSNDAVEALIGGFAGQLGAVMDMLGVAHRIVEEVLVEVLPDDGFNILLSAGAGDGIDDEKGLLFQGTESLCGFIFQVAIATC